MKKQLVNFNRVKIASTEAERALLGEFQRPAPSPAPALAVAVKATAASMMPPVAPATSAPEPASEAATLSVVPPSPAHRGPVEARVELTPPSPEVEAADGSVAPVAKESVASEAAPVAALSVVPPASANEAAPATRIMASAAKVETEPVEDAELDEAIVEEVPPEPHRAPAPKAKGQRKPVAIPRVPAVRSRRGHVQLASGVERGMLNWYLPPELRMRLTVLAAQRNVKISDLITELVEEALARHKR